MPYYPLSSKRTRCSPGSKRATSKGTRPVMCKGAIKKRKSSSRGCKYSRDSKTQKCLTKKQFSARMKKANKRFSRNKVAASFVKRIKSYKRPTRIHELV